MKPFLWYSGGIVDYWGLFFTEILEFDLAGAIIYSLLLLLSILLYRRIIDKLGVIRNHILITLFPFIFIFLLTFNHFHPVAINLKLLTALLFLHAIVLIPDKKITTRVFITLILVSLWYLVGLEFFVISLFYIAIISIKKRSVKKDVFVIITSIISVFFLNTYLFYTPFRSSLLDILTYESRIPFLLLMTYVMFILIPFIAMIKLNVSINSLLQIGIVLLFAIPLGIYSYDAINHNMGKIMAAGNRGDYNKVLEIRENTSINTRLISSYTNMALLHKGTLLSKMFKYRQDGGTDGLFPSRDFDNYTAFINMKLCYDVGAINPAIRWAMEAGTHLGYNAEILRHLILCHLINDNVKAAEKYYAILNKTLFHRNLKKHLGRMVNNYKNGNPEEIILQKRNQRPGGDY